jgi:hypothetical protein
VNSKLASFELWGFKMVLKWGLVISSVKVLCLWKVAIVPLAHKGGLKGKAGRGYEAY